MRFALDQWRGAGMPNCEIRMPRCLRRGECHFAIVSSAEEPQRVPVSSRMPVDYRNTNTIWTSILVETLSRLGLRTVVICPGSRSAPLAVAFAQHATIEAIPVLDERSAAFFALGVARRCGSAVALVCTSGTAGANFYPAVIEARESRVPLLLLTADRPPELRHCRAGQAIDQVKLFGNYPNWQIELALPSLEMNLLTYLRQTTIQAWERSHMPIPGPVHINCPFRDPLSPLPQPKAQALAAQFPEDFFSHIFPLTPSTASGALVYDCQRLFEHWQRCSRGLIIAGPAQPCSPAQYCRAIAQLSLALGWPVLAEALSPLRNYASLNPHLVATYGVILQESLWAERLCPEIVLRVGELPTSKELRTWLTETQPQQWVIDPSDQNLDPLHGRTVHLRLAVNQLVDTLTQQGLLAATDPPQPRSAYLEEWCSTEAKVRIKIDRTCESQTELREPVATWILSQVLPLGTPLFVANSTPVRDLEWFWVPGNRAVQPFFNRGANGIDGILSTALGVAHRNQPAVLLIGDLALLHDANGFLLRQQFEGHLTIVLLNNAGGGIFEMLPIAQFDPPFEQFFATPQQVDFAQLCAAYQVTHERILTWEQFQQRLRTLPRQGIRLLELRTDRKADALWRRKLQQTPL